MTVLNVLLSGIVGSTAYGLARPGSDVDRLGVFAAPTEELHGLRRPVESHVTNHPDRTLHEAAKWCRLALSGNPTVMELVWLPDDLYEVRTELGDDLIRLRTAFLSAKRVQDAYLGYATQQFRRLETRGDGSFSADTRKRTAKHARHLKRLCHQGLELYTTGRLTVRVEDPESYHEFGEQVAADAAAARPLLAEYEAAFDANRSALPDRPDEAAVEAWLRRVRADVYKAPAVPAPPTDQTALEADVDLTDGPVRCPLCPNTVTLHTPNGARAHFAVVHPEQRLTGRGSGPWPLLVTDEAEADVDQTARDRIRRVLCERDGNGSLWGTDMLEPDEYGEVADAVLAVLPEQTDQATLLLWAADQIDAETRLAKAHGVLEPDKFRPCRDASAQLRALAGCPACGAGIEHDVHCPTPESHNWGCGCETDPVPEGGPVYPDDDHSCAESGCSGEPVPVPQPADDGSRLAAEQPTETQAPRRRLTPSEHSAAWHAIEGAAGEEGADPATVLHAVLDRLGIDTPAAVRPATT